MRTDWLVLRHRRVWPQGARYPAEQNGGIMGLEGGLSTERQTKLSRQDPPLETKNKACAAKGGSRRSRLAKRRWG